MKTRTKILAVVMALIVISAVISSLYISGVIPSKAKTSNSTTALLELPSGQPAQWQIEVSGDFKQQQNLTLADMSKMPLTKVIANDNATYIGVTLFQFCNETGVGWDAGPLTVIGANGQSAALNIFEAWNSSYYSYSSYSPDLYNYQVMVLAFIKNGEWMTSATPGGPVELVAPTLPSSDQIQQVTEIQSAPWTVTITGNVANPITITGENLTDFQSQTIRGEFVPGDVPIESIRTSDWTGIPILNALQVAQASPQAQQVTITAIDGYTQVFTLQQVRAGEMMIGYQENGTALPLSAGGPFRVFAPTPDYRWGQYWVKFIKQITVS
jgi:DMSO/TMAO reductase YedYZ molybdopterin-dependent catalytic subunit